MAKEGKVKFFNEHKGFGFIEQADGTGDVFVHITELRKSGVNTLHEGDLVSFEKVDGKGGKFQAENISLLN